MAINKNKVMEAAQKFVEKNQLDKAIKEYQKIVEEDAKDVRVWLKLGDLFAKKGSKQEATDTYLRVAQFYSDQGFYLKAVAVYKQVLRLDPRLIDVNVRLGEVYRQLGLLSDAMQQYELVAAFFHREGKTREALATVRELVELDPENVATRIKLAELYSKEQMIKEAVAEFGKAADYLRANGRLDDFLKVAERLVWHQPDNHTMNRELAQLYLRRNDPRHALQKLQVCFKADPRDVDTLALLASAFLALDQRQKTVSVWKELARIHTENNQTAAAQDVYRRILSVAPDDPDALQGSGGRRAVGTGNQQAQTAAPVAPSPPAPVASPATPPRVATPIGSEPGERPGPRLATPVRTPVEPLVTMKGPARVATPMAHPPPISARSSASSTGVGVAVDVDEEREPSSRQTSRQQGEQAARDFDQRRPGELATLLEHADVCAKFGLRDKAISQLQRVLEIDPRSVDARHRLKDCYRALGRDGEAAAELGRLVELVAMHDRGRAQGFLGELAALVPGDGRVSDLATRFRLRVPEAGADDLEIEIVPGAESQDQVTSDSVDVLLEGSSDSAVDETTDIHAELDGELDGQQLDEEMTAIGGGTMEIDAELSVEIADPGDPGDDHELAFDEVTSASQEQADKTVDIGSASLDELLGEESQPEVEMSIDSGDEALAESMGPPPGEFDRAPQTERPVGLPRDAGNTSLEDDLDEADFFVSQGLQDEARAILHDLLGRHPNHPLISAKLRDLPSGDAVPGTDPPRPARKPTVIAKPQGGGADADTHFDLGMAYKEMGLLEEALKEFALARQAHGRAVQSYMMIGLCQMEVGRMTEAVEAFKAGLYVDGITDREAMALYFELGAAYEGLGDAREALYYFEKVHKRDPHFREVDQRVRGLTGGGPTPRSNGGREKTQPQNVRPEADSGDDALSALDSLLDEHDVTPT